MAAVGVNGLAVTLATGGALLVYSAIKNVTPADALRQVLGKPVRGKPISTPFGDVVSGLSAYQAGQAGAAVGAGAVAAGAVLAGGARAGGLIAAVRGKIGSPYVWATAGPDRFDCSGLVVWGLKQIGYSPPRFTTYTFGSWAKANGFTRVDRAQFAAGDIIVKPGHMAVATSNSRMVEAPHAGASVREVSIYGPGSQWWGWRMP